MALEHFSDRISNGSLLPIQAFSKQRGDTFNHIESLKYISEEFQQFETTCKSWPWHIFWQHHLAGNVDMSMICKYFSEMFQISMVNWLEIKKIFQISFPYDIFTFHWDISLRCWSLLLTLEDLYRNVQKIFQQTSVHSSSFWARTPLYASSWYVLN